MSSSHGHNEAYGPLSSSIMNYYKKFGQNRDLEKFLRLHRHTHTPHSSGAKSLSDESLYCSATALPVNTTLKDESDEFKRSLQNLSVLSGSSISKDKLNLSCESLKIPETISILETSQATKEVLPNKKGVNINFESNIEIMLPQNNELPPTSNPSLPPQQTAQQIPAQIIPQFVYGYPAAFIETIKAPIEIKYSKDKIIQTNVVENEIIKNADIVSHTSPERIAEEKIVPITKPAPIMVDCQTNYSPTSSIASYHKQKLEWDSMADVGYSKAVGIESGLSSLERNALKKFLANHGLNTDSNIILLSSKKMSDNKECINITDSRPSEKTKKKWKKAFSLIKDQHNFTTDPKIHSTPIDKKDVIETIENSCQTSGIEQKSQGVQVVDLNDTSLTFLNASDGSRDSNLIENTACMSGLKSSAASRRPSNELNANEKFSRKNSKKNDQQSIELQELQYKEFDAQISRELTTKNQKHEQESLIKCSKLDKNKSVKSKSSKASKNNNLSKKCSSDVSSGSKESCLLGQFSHESSKSSTKENEDINQNQESSNFFDESSHSMIIHKTPRTSLPKSDNFDDRSPSIDNASVGKYENEGHLQNSKSSSEMTKAESFEFLSGADYMKQSDNNNSKSPDCSSVSSHISFSKYDQLVPKSRHLSKLEKNLTVGVNLMNSLMKSKSLSMDSKNVLITKIIGQLEKLIEHSFNSNAGEKSHPRTKLNCEESNNPKTNFSQLSSVHKEIKISSIDKEDKTKLNRKESKNMDIANSSKSSKTLDKESEPTQKSGWLEPLTHAELDFELKNTPTPESCKVSEKNLQLSLIEANIKYLEKLKEFLRNGGRAENFLSGRDIKLNIDIIPGRKTQLDDVDSNSWRSHSHPKQNIRSKLETPDHTSNESINTFARHKKEEFIEKYNRMIGEKKRCALPKTSCYTKVNSFGSKYYSNPKKSSPPITKNQTTTSISSTEIFLSSSHSNYNPSVSHHTSQTAQNIATQTSDSLRRTQPVFEIKNSSRIHRTRLVNRQTNTKSNQITPRPISYTITLKEDAKHYQIDEIRQNKQPSTIRSQTECEIQGARLICNEEQDVGSIDNLLSSEYYRILESNRTTVSSLQNYLVGKRPNFFLKAEERRKYIAEMNSRR